MSAVLARPRQSAPLRLHLNHFLKFVTKIGSRVNAHKELLLETLRYLLSLAKNPTYKKRISAALDEVQNTVEVQQLCEDAVGTLTEFSMYYRELLDKVVSIDNEDEDWQIPLAGSAPSEELLKMTRAWREAEERLDFAALWSID